MLQSLDDQIVFAPRWPASPFPGLRPFRITATEDESLIFYGRNLAKDEILARTLLPDASGSDVSGQLYDVLRSDDNGLWLIAETLAPRAAPNPLLILIDQFEEVFASQVSEQSESKKLLDLIVTFWA